MGENSKILRWLPIIIAIIAMVATVVGVWRELRPSKREITAQVLASNELTSVANVPNLRAHYTYLWKGVDHLWEITVSFINSGEQTIIGEGQQKTLIQDGVLLAFPEDTEILNIEEEAKDFPITVAKEDMNHFKLKFSQWREGERVTLSFYVAASEPIAAPLLPIVETRDIVDGDVVISELRVPAVSRQQLLIDRLPDPIRIPVVLMGYLSVSFCILALFLVPLEVPKSFRLHQWKRRNMSEFAKYIEGLEGLNPHEKQLYLRQPYRSPGFLWTRFEGEKLTITNALFDSLLTAATMGPVVFLIFLSSALLMASAILR